MADLLRPEMKLSECQFSSWHMAISFVGSMHVFRYLKNCYYLCLEAYSDSAVCLLLVGPLSAVLFQAG